MLPTPPVRVMMTRDADFFVPLHERVRKARRVQADLFVSLHADAFFTPHPQGASVSRGGETNGPASVYAIAKWDEWLRKYAPPGAADYDFYQSLPALAQGNVAQQIFWYTAFTASMAGMKRSAGSANMTPGRSNSTLALSLAKSFDISE